MNLTMKTVVKRTMHVATSFDHKHVVIIVDPAQFPQRVYAVRVVSALVQKSADSNRSAYARFWTKCDVIESDLFKENTPEHVLAGRDCPKGTRAHKLTLQAK